MYQACVSVTQSFKCSFWEADKTSTVQIEKLEWGQEWRKGQQKDPAVPSYSAL